ncbi:MAG: tRNA (N6-isopentenyl adenosine(37)-C2)-methylthiotransferase MiaB [Firmicutes bacterium]|nr:tRNA (N6-isopentenyl adenosine(37)-C2)-methylthiotransferase MiaB [Bacillota bacterium]
MAKTGAKTYYITTMGCQMNEHDSERIAGLLEAYGYVQAEDISEADLILFNTCCVRENPENKLYGRLGEIKRLKEKNPNLIVGVCGCMVQQDVQRERLEESYPYVDLIFGTHNLHRVPALLERAEAGERVIEVWDEAQEQVEGVPAKRGHDLKAWVNVTFGCDNFCSYCIVPYVRGRCRSREKEAVLSEIRDLVAKGYREVTLLGQNVNAYGKDLDSPLDFADLLAEVNAIPGLWRVRFTTSHPRDVDDKMIEALARLEKVCEHLHLPLQSGSSRILARMNRGYTSEQYLKLVEKIKRAVPGISLTTDIIVGFPGETDEDFAETMRVVEEVRYDSAFTFVYSPRVGTPAAKMPDQVPEEVKKERIMALVDLQKSISEDANRSYLGKEVEVLVEGPSKNNDQVLASRTRTNKLVHFSGGPELIGKLVTVKITEITPWTLYGEMVGESK